MKDDDPAAQAKLAAIKSVCRRRSTPAAALMKMAKLGAVIDGWMEETDVAISAVQCWTVARRILRRRALHGDEHDEQRTDVQRLRSGYLRRHRHARAAARLRHAQRAARLEQQLRRRSEQSRLLPLQQSAQAFLRGRQHGLSGDHRRHRGQGEHLRHLRGPRESRRDELRALLHRRLRRAKFAAMSATASSRTIRSRPSAARAWSRSRSMQDLLRYICEHGFEHHVAANFSTVSSVVYEAAHALSRLGYLLAPIRSI